MLIWMYNMWNNNENNNIISRAANTVVQIQWYSDEEIDFMFTILEIIYSSIVYVVMTIVYIMFI